MITLSHGGNRAPMLFVVALMLCADTALAQSATEPCKSAGVIPLTGTEPAPKIVVNPKASSALAPGEADTKVR